MPRLPLIPTLVVAGAIAVMIGLGIWQLQRAEWKDGLLARYAAAGDQASVAFPRGSDFEDVLYRRSRVECESVVSTTSISGRNADGASGLAHVATCDIDGGGTAEIRLGWNRDPAPVAWGGGMIEGVLTPAGDHAALVATTPPAGLEPLAKPDPQDLPNNHTAYAWQWFFFAIVAAVIYGIALRKRGRDAGTSP